MPYVVHMPNTNQKPRRTITTREAASELEMSVSQVTRYAKDMGAEKLPGRTGPYLLTRRQIEKIRELRKAGAES